MGRSLLEVNGGDPPPITDEHQAAEHGADQLPPSVQPLAAAEPADEWTADTVRTLVALPFMAAHIVARRRGPADAWMPDDEELSVMAGPLLNMANRYAMLRALSRFGDPVAFTAAVGTYTVAESRRIARWRLEHGEEAFDLPDDELATAGLHVTAAAPGARGEQPPVRPWRPPVVPEEA